MCTVSYIPPNQNRSFVLTSNRDEKEFRATLAPKIYRFGNGRIVFPKDEKAGGTWIAMNDAGTINCLLNGGINAHQKQEHHTKSRGAVMLEFTNAGGSPHDFFSPLDLSNVEPFTMVALKQRNGKIETLNEFIWDGAEKHFRPLAIDQAYIWSSVTLYNKEQRKMRKTWFNQFCESHKQTLSNDEIVDFHSGSHTHDDSVNVIMKREGGLKTLSITQVSAMGERLQMSYADLLNHTQKNIEL